MYPSFTGWMAAASVGSLLAVQPPASAPPPADTTREQAAAAPAAPRREVVVVGTRRPPPPTRAQSRVDRAELEERLPRSAPDALRYEPGVYVQQSAHGQGSPYIRGRTGQQTVVLFDGVRLNTSTWRQGPNQYFFTVDSAAIRSIEVTRGGASTLFGSDAIAGVIEARPIEPDTRADRPAPGVNAKVSLRGASADGEIGGRAQLDARLTPSLSVLVGGGHRRVGALKSGGPITSPATGVPPMVPAFEADGVTQLGTGYRELTGDSRLTLSLPGGGRLVGAGYLYRQYDSPRTDQCPAPFAPRDECLSYDEQFRSLAYLAYESVSSPSARAAHWRLVGSYQRQHERRTLRRPSSFVRNGGRDDVDSFGLSLKGQTAALARGEVTASLRWGGDVYLDQVASRAWSEFTDVVTVIPLSRGQYLDDSQYLQGGVFGQLEAHLGTRFTARGGLRLGGAAARADAEPTSGTAAIDQQWLAVVGHLGFEARLAAPLALLASYDRSYRAPNLDDLTSRQQTGPGFQFENAGLRAETSDTYEAGARLDAGAAGVDLWLFRSVVKDAIARSLRQIEQCPPATPACATSWSRFQLVNAPGLSIIDGVELSARVTPGPSWQARASVTYARGEGPNPQPAPDDPALPHVARVPLSRVPPLNGSLELRRAFGHDRWQRLRPYLGGGLRWALLQDRLAPTDRGDARIPEGGTPGFLVLDLRAGFRFGDRLLLAAVLENLGNAPYRYHGSSVNGPGRGLIVNLEGSL
jgi:outer membrane receptor protein involved in Fe transport